MDNLTGKTINLFTPNAANEANRAAFAEEYGMELPATASETWKAPRHRLPSSRLPSRPCSRRRRLLAQMSGTRQRK